MKKKNRKKFSSNLVSDCSVMATDIARIKNTRANCDRTEVSIIHFNSRDTFPWPISGTFNHS